MTKNQPDLRPLLIERDPDRGGVISMGLGRLGSGKTNSMIDVVKAIFDRKVRIARELKEDNPRSDEGTLYAKRMAQNELVFWIGESDCQWRRLPEWVHPLIFVERGLKLDFYQDGQLFDPMTIPFDSYTDLVKHAQPNRVNVVYVSNPHKARDFIIHLIKTPVPRWVSVVIDEVENMCPGYEGGETWHKLDTFVKLIKRARKRRLSLYTATQVKALMDHRFVALVMFWFLHTGARHIPQTRVNQYAIDALKINEAWLATSAQFQKVSFPLYAAKSDMIVEGLEEYKAPSPPPRKPQIPEEAVK